MDPKTAHTLAISLAFTWGQGLTDQATGRAAFYLATVLEQLDDETSRRLAGLMNDIATDCMLSSVLER